MSTHDLKLQQSSCQSGVKASVTCVVSDQERFYTHTDKSRFQNVCEQEKLHLIPSVKHIHNKEDLETKTTASPSLLQLKDQEKSTRDLQISQIILLRPKKNSSLTSEEQRKSARFTSTVSISLPTGRNKKVTAEDQTLQTNLSSTLDNQHHTELRDVILSTEQCGESNGGLFKNGDGQSTFDEDSITTLRQHGHNTSGQGQNTGIQHNLGFQIQIVPKDPQRHSTQLVHEVQTEVNKQFGASDCREHCNAPTSPKSNKDLDSDLKACTDSKLFAQHSEKLNQVLSLANLPASHSENPPKPASTMLTSTLASVLGPPWNGRLRNPKQGGSEVEHEPQDGVQNVNPSTFHQPCQPILPSQRQRSVVWVNDNDMLLTAVTSYSPDWQKENSSPNITTTIQPKRPILKSSSVGTMYNTTDIHPFPPSMNSRQVPNSSHSGNRLSKTRDEHEPFKSLSSKPTTSSLLLSLRRSHLRSLSADPTQMQTPITSSVRSLTLPSRIVLKTPSFAQSVSTDEQFTNYPDTPTGTEEMPVSQFPFSSTMKNRAPLRTPMFLKKSENDISKTLEAPVARVEEEHFTHSKSKTDQLGVIKTQHSSYLVLLRTYSSTEDLDPVEQSTGNINLQNLNVTKQQTTPDATMTPKVSTNYNVQQSGFYVRNLKSQSIQNITAINSSTTSTFTDRLSFSPRKDSSVDGISPTNLRQTHLDSKKHSHSSQSPMDISSPLSPARPLRSVPSIYSYLRESSPSPSSHIQRSETSPPKQDGAATLHGDKQTIPSRFSFDFNPSVPQVQALQISSYDSSTHMAPAQSLPPDFGRKTAPRLSTSPYSSLISSRPALNNTLQALSSSPASKTLTQSTSYDTVTTHADSKSFTYTNSTRRQKEQLASPNNEQRRPVQAYTSVLDNHRPAQPCLSQPAPDASFVMESKSANLSSHPSQPSTSSNNVSKQQHDGLMALQSDKSNAYPKHRLSEKEKYLLPKVESETLLKAEKETSAVQIHERLQETLSTSSKKGLFASRAKKDNSFSSASLPDKEVSPQYLKTKRHSPVFKTSSRIDQMLNRLKLTFGVKRSDSTLDTITKKNKNIILQPSDNEIFEKPKTEEKTCSEGQLFNSLTTNKSSLGSLSPLPLRKSEPTQNRSNTEITYSGCMWEVPNSSLTTSKASFGSLSPLTIKKSESTSNMEQQKRSITMGNKQNDSGCTWEAPNSSLSPDKDYFTSFRSLSPLPLQKSPENKLNIDQQKRHSDENRSYSRSFSPHRLKAQSMNRSATLPHYKKSSVGPPSPFYLFDFDSEDIQNDNVFYSPVSKKTNSLCESDDFSPLSSSKSPQQQNLMGSRLSSSCADLKYGLHNKRSYSVSSVLSSRPSGPGRISTSSISDLSSLDDFVPKGSYTVVDSPLSSCQSPTYDAKSATGEQFQPEYTDDNFENDYADPTPPPSPTLSSSPRRISQAPSMSSPMRTSPENLSPPRGILPSRSYTTSLAVFEESGSDTTTDDEYYLGNGDDDELETEL